MTGPRLDGAQWAAVLRGEITPEEAAGSEPQHWTPEQRRSAMEAENRRLHEELRRTEGDLAVAVAEAQRARAVLQDVRAIHKPLTDDEDGNTYCTVCQPLLVYYPCPTVAAVDAVRDLAAPPPAPEGEQR